MKNVEFDIDGRSASGTVALKGGTLWIHLDGETFAVDIEAERRSGRGRSNSRGSSAHPGEIVAPMPGKIIKILAQKGSDVKVGQVLLVMEAMKMEYTLKAQADGKVSEVSCAPGDQVALGQILAKLEVA